jgi:hypothetical protein
LNRILLDRFCEAKLPENYTLVNTEVEFLKKALSQESLFIQGDWLCEWAETFFTGREIPFSYTRSLVRELKTTFPFLTPETAAKIFSLLEKNSNTDIHLTEKEILKGCFPAKHWEETPSKGQAAAWLLWLVENRPDDFYIPFLTNLSSFWLEIEPRFKLAYQCLNPDEAWELLIKWVSYSDSEIVSTLGAFPLALPKKLDREKNNYWEQKVIQSKGKFFLDFLNHESNHQDKLSIVSKTIKYFQNNPQEINDKIFNKLNQFATGKELKTLLSLKPIDVPRSLPDHPDDILAWFKQEYSPYRKRSIEVNDEEAKKISIQRAIQFAEWYLEYYPKAIAKGKDIAPFKTHEIKEKNKKAITLLVILDGLNAFDGQILLNEILSKPSKNHLNIVENTYIYSLLPTVTEFTKNRIVYGTLANNFDKLEKLGIDLPDKTSPSQDLSNAKEGDLIIWRIQEPDFTYHKEGQSSDLAAKIAGQMIIISNRIQDAIEDVPLYQPIRVIITTDHGRILGKSNRTVNVPDGMTAHGRAAWGISDIKFSSKGYLVENDIVYLSKETYHLDDRTVAVVMTDDAFVHETYKEEISPHGGLFPEEVILPWMVFEKNVEKPSFKFTLSGTGVANKESTAILKIMNLSSYSAKLVSGEFDLGTHKEFIQCEFLISPKKEETFELPINRWPSSDQIQTGSLVVEIGLPNGEILFTTISLTGLKSESMYARDNILDDLL